MRNIDFISASSSSGFHTRTSLLNTMKSISVSRELFRFRFYFSDWRLVEDGNITWRNGRRSGDKPRYYRKSAPRKRVLNFISIPGCRKTPSEKMNMHLCSWPSKSCGKCFRSCRHSLLLGGSKNNDNGWGQMAPLAEYEMRWDEMSGGWRTLEEDMGWGVDEMRWDEDEMRWP